MKAWITRPSCAEVFMGGLRGTRVWLVEPSFSHRATIPEFNLYEPETDHLIATVYSEEGWQSENGGLSASPFLSQDEAVKTEVGLMMIRSCLLEGWSLADWSMTNSDRILDDNDYERSCAIHWKRFLLEIDLKTSEIKVIEPKVILPSGCEDMLQGGDIRLLMDHSQYLGGDIRSPYTYEAFRHLKLVNEDAWI